MPRAVKKSDLLRGELMWSTDATTWMPRVVKKGDLLRGELMWSTEATT